MCTVRWPEAAEENGIDQYVQTWMDLKNTVVSGRTRRMWARLCLASIVCGKADIKNIMKISLAKNAHCIVIIHICTRWDAGMLSEPSASYLRTLDAFLWFAKAEGEHFKLYQPVMSLSSIST